MLMSGSGCKVIGVRPWDSWWGAVSDAAQCSAANSLVQDIPGKSLHIKHMCVKLDVLNKVACTIGANVRSVC